jgi:hypothetical protein
MTGRKGRFVVVIMAGGRLLESMVDDLLGLVLDALDGGSVFILYVVTTPLPLRDELEERTSRREAGIA